MKITPGDIVLTLFNARTAAHVCHLQTDSYAKHMALGDFYGAIGDIADRYAETWMGCYGEKLKLALGTTVVAPQLDPVMLLDDLKLFLRDARDNCDESHLQQILDDGLELVCSTLYKLQRLA